ILLSAKVCRKGRRFAEVGQNWRPILLKTGSLLHAGPQTQAQIRAMRGQNAESSTSHGSNKQSSKCSSNPSSLTERFFEVIPADIATDLIALVRHFGIDEEEDSLSAWISRKKVAFEMAKYPSKDNL